MQVNELILKWNWVNGRHKEIAPQGTAIDSGDSVQKYNVFVGNLDKSVNNEELKNYFKQEFSSVVNGKIIYDSVSHWSKGFGFVELTNYGEYKSLLNSPTQRFFHKQQLIINPAKSKNENKNNIYSGNNNANVYSNAFGNSGTQSNDYNNMNQDQQFSFRKREQQQQMQTNYNTQTYNSRSFTNWNSNYINGQYPGNQWNQISLSTQRSNNNIQWNNANEIGKYPINQMNQHQKISSSWSNTSLFLNANNFDTPQPAEIRKNISHTNTDYSTLSGNTQMKMISGNTNKIINTNTHNKVDYQDNQRWPYDRSTTASWSCPNLLKKINAKKSEQHSNEEYNEFARLQKGFQDSANIFHNSCENSKYKNKNDLSKMSLQLKYYCNNINEYFESNLNDYEEAYDEVYSDVNENEKF